MRRAGASRHIRRPEGTKSHPAIDLWQTRPISEQRRNFFRVFVNLPVTVCAVGDDDAPGEPFTAETQDLSAGGALLRGDHQFGAGQRVLVEMESDDPPLSMQTTARVLRTWADERGRTLAALQFERLTDANQSALIRYCNAAERIVIERRMAVRTTVELPVTVESAGTQFAGYTIEVGADSAVVNSRAAVTAGERVRMTFTGDTLIKLDADVTRVGNGEFAVTYPDASRQVQAAIVRTVLAEERRAANRPGAQAEAEADAEAEA